MGPGARGVEDYKKGIVNMRLKYWFHNFSGYVWVPASSLFGDEKPIKDWSHAAKVMLASSLMTIVFYIAPAWALSSAQLDALVPTIIAAESSGNPRAVADGGKARGLMQIQRATWKRFSDYHWDEAFDPLKNIHVGRAVIEYINEEYSQFLTDGVPGVFADRQHILYTYNTGRYRFGDLPAWTKKHPNKIYRRIFNNE